MKKIAYLALLFCLFRLHAGAQFPIGVYIYFENNDYDDIELYADSSQNHNIWQIGQPLKKYFTQAPSGKRCLVTDSLNAYPINNTSSFYIKVPVHHWGYKYADLENITLKFISTTNTDTLNDYGKLELSINGGLSYFVPTHDSSFIRHIPEKNDYTGNMYSTQEIKFYFPDYFYKDSVKNIYVRFTFYSDSVLDSLDGWMIDDLVIGRAYKVGIPEILTQKSPFIYPTVFNEGFAVKREPEYEKFSLLIFNIEGKTVWKEEQTDADYFSPGILPGIYIVKYVSEKNVKTQKIIKL